MNKILKKTLVHLVAMVVFAVLSTVLFYPELQGKAMRQGDAINHEGMVRDIEGYMADGGENPNWTGGMFGGMPTYTLTMDSGVQLFSMVNLHHAECSALMIFLAMAGFYLMLQLMRVNPYMAMVGAVAYGLSTYFPIIISAGHITKMWALQWAPPLIGAIWYAYRENKILGGALSALFTALLVGCAHHQITYYFMFVILALIIGQFIMAYKDKVLKRFFVTSAVLLFAGGLGVGSNAVVLYYTSDYADVSTRGGQSAIVHENTANETSGLDRDYITQWSYGKAETFNLFIPNFMGGGANFTDGGEVQEALSKYQVPSNYYKNIPSYYGTQPFTSGPVYIGALVIFLAIFALFMIPGGYKWWILAPTTLAIMLAWGHNFNFLTNFFIDNVPMYSKFRVPSMILVVVQWALPLLAALGLCKLYKLRDNLPVTYTPVVSPSRAVIISGGIAGGFALLSMLIIPQMMNFTGQSDAQMGLPSDVLVAMQAERASMLIDDSIRSLLFVVLGSAALWFYIKGKIKSVALFGLIIVTLVTIDLFGVDRRYVSEDKFVARSEAKSVQMYEVDKGILTDKDNFRVLDLTVDPYSSSRASYFHRSVGGYHAAKMQRYQDLIDTYISTRKSDLYIPAFSMLNTRYIIISPDDYRMNPYAIGNLVSADSIIWAGSPAEELSAIGYSDFDPSRVAIVSEEYRDKLSGVSLGVVDYREELEMTDYQIGTIDYEVNLGEPRLIVFSEIYHKDWKVTIDGEAAEIIPVNYLLRGVVVGEGDHTLRFTFEIPNKGAVYSVAAVSTITIILWIVCARVFAIVSYRKQSKGNG